jgi:quercetin dioxygenase-like cupin family protein
VSSAGAFEEDLPMLKRSRETTGTARRAARHMSGRGIVFDLAAELRSLRQDLEFTSGNRAAKTLAKTDGLRVTLVLLKRGAALNPEAVAGGATLQVLDGQIRVELQGEQLTVKRAGVIVLGDNLRERVTALEEAAFLVTVAWPAGAGASPEEAAHAEHQNGSDSAVSAHSMSDGTSSHAPFRTSSR